jgi:hypothetical protein
VNDEGDFAHPRYEHPMTTLLYKMTHKGDPNPQLGWWGVADCMGQVRGFTFDAVIGIGGCSWWTNQTSRVGEIVWVGLDPQQMPVRGKRGPMVRFAHFRYFSEGELLLSEIAPKLDKSMLTRRFRLYDFSRIEEEEIEKILALAQKWEPSTEFVTQAIKKQTKGQKCGPKLRRSQARCTQQ